MPKDDDVIATDQMPEEPIVEPEPEPEPEAGEPEPELILGKYKTQDDVVKAYSDLENKLGTQGSKMAELEKDKEFLINQLQQKEKQPDPIEDTQVDFNAELDEIARQIDDGEISSAEGGRKTASIAARMGEESALKKFQTQQNQMTVEESRGKFIEQNPDFLELQQSGQLEGIKKTLPGFHDDISAFYELKAQNVTANTAAAVEAARAEGVELGKAQMAKIVDGSKNTQKVLTSSNSESAKKIGDNKASLTGNKMRDSGLEALQRARGG